MLNKADLKQHLIKYTQGNPKVLLRKEGFFGSHAPKDTTHDAGRVVWMFDSVDLKHFLIYEDYDIEFNGVLYINVDDFLQAVIDMLNSLNNNDIIKVD